MAVIGLVFDFVLCQIDVEDGFGAAADAWEQLPKRDDDVERAQRRADGFSQQRAEYEMVFFVEKNDFGFVRREFLPQCFGAFDAAETAADDDDARFGHCYLDLCLGVVARPHTNSSSSSF